jgi:hypothetical protein
MSRSSAGLSRVRSRWFGALVASACLIAGAAGGLVGSSAPAGADTIGPINFETYTPGVINGQDGWTSQGAAGSGCAVYDQAVVNNSSYPAAPASFGTKSFRSSDAVTSGCFSDQTFSKPVVNAAGEPGADAGSFPTGTLQNYFSASFDIASATGAAQGTPSEPTHISISPDRGDGARMSYVRLEDDGTGWNVFFDDYRDVAPLGSSGNLDDGCGTGDNFTDTQIATDLPANVAHNIRFNMQFVPGPHNDIVQVYIDGVLASPPGSTSWEDYYRYCGESGGGTGGPLADQSRIVRTILFREAGDAIPADAGRGFLIDNVSLATGDVPNPPVISSVFDGTGSSVSPTAVGVQFTVPPSPPGGQPITSETATCAGVSESPLGPPAGPTGSATGLGSPIFIGGLATQGLYQCTVTATNMFGSSSSTPFFVFVGGTGECTELPTAPGSLSTAPGNASATVSWAPASGTCVAGYVVTPYVGGVAQPSTLVNGHGTTTVVKGLTNGVSYTFTVAAENGSAVGPASSMTGPVTAGAPAAVTSLHVTRVAKGSLKVAFGTPANNGSPITGYAAVCSSTNHGVPKGKSGKSGPLTVTGLSAGKTYTCTVKATNKRGTSPASHASAAIKA